MKLTTFAISLSSATLSAAIIINDDDTVGPNDHLSGDFTNMYVDKRGDAENDILNAIPTMPNGGPGIMIGDHQTISVPEGQIFDASGIHGVPTAIPTMPNGGPGIMIGDHQTISVPESQTFDASGIDSAQTAAVSAPEQQDVALLVRGPAGANAEVSGSLELKQLEDGTSYVYVKNDSDARMFSLADGVASVKDGANVYVVGHMEAHGGVSLLAAGSAEASAVTQQKLEFNAQGMVSNVKFYASAEMKVGISVNGDIPADCQPIEVYKKPMAAVAGSAHVSAGISMGASAHGWSNATMRTVTDYVTYCPEETTITLTTCISEVCNPHEIVVTGETTVTVTGECLVPETAAMKSIASRAPVAAASAAPSSKAPRPATVAQNSRTSGPQVSSFNKASRNFAGVAGIAGIIALMI